MSRGFKRLNQLITFSFYNPSSSPNFLSLLLLKLKPFFSKTLRFLMDSVLFPSHSPSPDFDDVVLFPDPIDLSLPLSDPLYFVPFRWWSEAKDALYGGSSEEVGGVVYNATSLLKRADVFRGDDYNDSEIVLDMRREGQTEKSEEGVSSEEFALLSEWMFLRALKWHTNEKNVGGFLAPGDGKRDIFSLQIRLLFMPKTSSLVIRITEKDNEVGDFHKACSIFCVESTQLRIWDFSGQTNQFFLNDRKLCTDSSYLEEEIHLELQVFGYSRIIEAREGKCAGQLEGHSKVRGPSSSSSHCMNGSTDNEYLNSRVELSQCGETSTVGLTGMCNLGNTCFMNSAIQCLSHTPELLDYFLGDFKKDLNFENPLGMKGKLASAFGDILRKLWAPGAAPIVPRAFKSAIADFAPQFGGYNQHDSQEFLAFLLDGLHEDLNRVRHKPYHEVKDGEGRPDDEVADEHWRNHLSRNDSVIVDLFQGQYRSTLVCPVCDKKSVTFDPFMHLSLPLPSTSMRKMTLTVVYNDGSTLPCPVTITVPKDGRTKDLVQALSLACSLGDHEVFLIAEIFNSHIIRLLEDPSDSIELIRDADRLVAYRLPKETKSSPLVVFMHQRKEKSLFHSISSLREFGIPLVARMSDFSRGSLIRKLFLELLNPFLMPVEESFDDYDGTRNTDNQDAEMEDVIVDGDVNLDSEAENDTLLETDFQFYLDSRNSKNSKICMDEPISVPDTSKIINVYVSWPNKLVDAYDTARLSLTPEVCKPALITKKAQESISLYKCLDSFLQEEPLGPEDMWYCPSCKRHRQASKKLDLWRSPKILVIHLKRFSYTRFLRNKLETFVDFPIDDLNLSSYIIQKYIQDPHRYMLYAVINHYGGLGGGHYTAFVQHGRNWWYEFDDSHVSPVNEDQIKTSAAYVLFYKKV